MSRFICIASLALVAGLGLSVSSSTNAAVMQEATMSAKAADFMRLALNPQPEPPGKAKSNRYFKHKSPSSEDTKKTKTPVTPATKY